MLKLVPFSDAWVNNARLDLKAIYRRPQWTQNEFDEWVPKVGEDGLPLWDLTTPQRVLNHNKLLAKGFEYVTLATREDLYKAGRNGTIPGDWKAYDQHQTGGPWNAKMYLASRQQSDSAELQQLQADIEQFGAEAVEAIRRRTQPNFRIPESLKVAAVVERKKPGPKPKTLGEAVSA